MFTVERKYIHELTSRLDRLVSRIDTEKYCGKQLNFALLEPDLFGDSAIGYGGCGSVLNAGEDISLGIELSEAHLHHATLTINLLTTALAGDFGDKPKASNRFQQVDLETCCAHTAHGHSVGGYISSQMREWLRKQWHQLPHDTWMKWASVPEEVIDAMRQTWCAVASKDLRGWANECGGNITEDGRFILNCFGNACDLAIYPDNVCIDDHSSVRFSCHNLDGARQQLTLLAGLAKLCELSRIDSS